jgi:hypothetical protein
VNSSLALRPSARGLRKSQVVGIRRLPAANEAGPLSNRSHVTPDPEFGAVLAPLIRSFRLPWTDWPTPYCAANSDALALLGRASVAIQADKLGATESYVGAAISGVAALFSMAPTPVPAAAPV